MSDEPVDSVAAYQNALAELGDAVKAVDAVRDLVGEVGKLMADWRALHGTAAGLGVFDPDRGAVVQRLSLADWPASDALRAALRRRHEALARAREAWSLVERDRRTRGLANPDDYDRSPS